MNGSEGCSNCKSYCRRFEPTGDHNGCRIFGVEDERSAVHPGADLLQQFQHLADDRVFQDRETGETTSWLCKAGDQAGFDRIANPDE